MKKRISIIIPTYNEESNIKQLYLTLKVALQDLSYQIEYIFIDDGSADSTFALVKSLAENDHSVYFIQLSRNFGHQSALKAGLDCALGDCVISMDCDLQHPPEVILELIKKWEEGYDVVYTKRKDIKGLSWFKRLSSSLFYKIHNKLSDIKLESGTADFRLMSRDVVNAFSYLNESDLFIRGLVRWAGFKQVAVSYTPNDRFGGKTKYNLGQMISLAFNGITSFSTRPLKMVAYVGLILFLFSLLLVPYSLVSYFIDNAVSGWTSIMISIFLFGSLQLLMLGIIGIYLSKLVIQSKHRPLYFIRDTNYNLKK